MSEAVRRRIALLSVYDKTGIVEFAKRLIDLGFTILASGGTARKLEEAGLPVRDVASLVGGDAILGHKVVTLSREVHAGLLADYLTEMGELEGLGLQPIDLVYCNLYPLTDEIAKPEATRASVIGKTDIGGPTMLRSGGKGGRIVICDPADQQKVLGWLDAGEPDREEFLNGLFVKVEQVIGEYCLASATYHSGGAVEAIVGTRTRGYCYGENKGQVPAQAFSTGSDYPLADERFVQVAGAGQSYNNGTDLYRLTWTMSTAAEVMRANAGASPFIAIGVKHGNPCGAAFSDDPAEAIGKMVTGDPLAMFGGSVMLNFELDADLAEVLATCGMPDGTRQRFDCVIASDVTGEAIEAMKRKGDKCRILVNPALDDELHMNRDPLFRQQHGGFQTQPSYEPLPAHEDPRWEWVGRELTEEERLALYFAWSICATSNSNTITLVTPDGQMIGNGVGQQARVYAARLAVERATTAGHETAGALAVSDSFFPEVDGPEALIAAGVAAVQTTSGSQRDDRVKKCFGQQGVVVGMIPDAVGRGFAFHG